MLPSEEEMRYYGSTATQEPWVEITNETLPFKKIKRGIN